MCFPEVIFGISGLLQHLGAKSQERALNRTFEAERARQKDYESQQTARFQNSLDETGKLTDPNAQARAVSAREGPLANAIVSASPAAGGYLPGSSSAPSVVATAADKAGAASDAASRGLAHALATLGGTTDSLQRNDIAINRNSGLIDQLSGFKRGSLGVHGAEMQAASHKGETLKGIGTLLQQLALAAATGGASAPAGLAKLGPAAISPELLAAGRSNVYQPSGSI